MADDAGMHRRDTPPAGHQSFADMAKEELGLTARAFFAPVFGAMHVMRVLLSADVAPNHAAPPPKPTPDRHHERDAA
jgi:hypothetical protein